MRPSPPGGRALTSLVVLLCAQSALARADCPQSCISFGFQPGHCGSEPAYELQTIDGCFNRASYDIPHATISALTEAGLTNCYAGVEVVDEFVIESPLLGPEVQLNAVLEAHLELYGAAFGEQSFAEIQGPTGTIVRVDLIVPADEQGSGPFTKKSLLMLPISATHGLPFALRFRLGGGAAESGFSGQAHWWFTGLPDEVAVRSCNGFRQDGVVTAIRTWGKLKATYR